MIEDLQDKASLRACLRQTSPESFLGHLGKWLVTSPKSSLGEIAKWMAGLHRRFGCLTVGSVAAVGFGLLCQVLINIENKRAVEVAAHDPASRTLTLNAADITDMSVTPDGRFLVTASTRQTVLFDLQSMEVSASYRYRTEAAAIRPDGKELAISGEFGSAVVFWDPVSRETKGEIRPRLKQRIAYISDGSEPYCAGQQLTFKRSEKRAVVQVWAPRSRTMLRELKIKTSFAVKGLASLRLLPEHERVLMLGQDTTDELRLYDMCNMKLLYAHKLPDTAARLVGANANGEIAAVYHAELRNPEVVVVDIKHGKELMREGCRSGLPCVAINEATNRLALHHGRRLEIRQLHSDEGTAKPLAAMTTSRYASRLLSTPDGRRLLLSLGQNVQIIDLETLLNRGPLATGQSAAGN